MFPGEASANLLFFFIQLRIINSEYRVPLPRNYNKRCPNQKHIGYTVAYMSVYLVCGRAQYLLLLMMPRRCPTIKSSASCTDHQLAGDLTLIAKHSNYRPSVWLLRFICLNTFYPRPRYIDSPNTKSTHPCFGGKEYRCGCSIPPHRLLCTITRILSIPYS